MADQYIQVATDGPGKKIDNTEITVGANVVNRQRVNLSDPTDASAHAAVEKSAVVTGDEYGLVVQALLADMREMLKSANRVLQRSLGMAGEPATGRLRVAVDLNAAQTLATVTTCSTVTTCATVTNLAQMGGFALQPTLLQSTDRNLWANSIRPRIT